MKKIIVLLAWSILILGCSNKKEKVSKEVNVETKVEIKKELKKEKTSSITEESTSVVTNFLKDINSLNQVKKPIKTFQNQVENVSDKTVIFGKENIQEVLNEAVNYIGFVIVVEDHTIIKIDDIKNCQKSGSWNACMPYGKGFNELPRGRAIEVSKQT